MLAAHVHRLGCAVLTTSGPTFARARREVPGSPRAVFRAVLEEVPHPHKAAVTSAAAKTLGLRRLSEMWEEASRAAAEGDPLPWMRAADETRAYLTRRSEGGLSPEEVEARVDKAIGAAARCGVCLRVYEETGREEPYVAALRCNSRACLDCLRRRLRRVSDRWAPLFGAPLLPGYRKTFLTIGSLSPVESAADVRCYLRRLGTVFRTMREGLPSCAIPERAWVAGLRSLEVVPRVRGGFGHAHLLVVCRAFWPYGLRAVAKPGDTRPALSSLGRAPTAEELGFREVLRRAGCGEVFRDDRIDEDDADAAVAYMRKIEKYMRKVEHGEEEPSRSSEPSPLEDGASGADTLAAMPWDRRRDIQRAMRGARLMDAFGDARGLLAGPDEVRRSRSGRPCGTLALRGVFDPEREETWKLLPGGLVPTEDGDETTIERRTYYREDTVDAWSEWCDTRMLREKLLTVA